MNTLRICGALIRKDMRYLSGFMALLLVIMSAASFWNSVSMHIRQMIFPAEAPLGELAASILNGGPFMLAVILAIALNLEWNSGSRSMQLLVPVPKSNFLFSTTAAVIISGFVISLISLWIGYLPWNSVSTWVIQHVLQLDDQFLRQSAFAHTKLSAGHYISIILRQEYWQAVMQNMTTVFLYCGIACFTQGITIKAKRFRFALWIYTLMITIGVYLYIRSLLIPDIPFQDHEYTLTHSPQLYVFSWLAGAVFLTVGLLSFNRYAEA